MVKIPQRGDPTLNAMCKAIEAKIEAPRDYLGASLIGKECAREVYYTYNGYPQIPFDANTLMNFEDGHRTEDLTAARLRMVDGIELITHKPDGKQLGFSALAGKFKGHYDGVITGILQAPKTPHIWECKASATKKFNEFTNAKLKFGEKNALENWNKNYYVQANLYMHYEEIDRHYLTVAGAGGRGYSSCRTEYNPHVAAKYIERANKIIHATTPPPKINERPDFYICRWCDHRKTCHG